VPKYAWGVWHGYALAVLVTGVMSGARLPIGSAFLEKPSDHSALLRTLRDLLAQDVSVQRGGA
jgi:hypothetical protein